MNGVAYEVAMTSCWPQNAAGWCRKAVHDPLEQADWLGTLRATHPPQLAGLARQRSTCSEQLAAPEHAERWDEEHRSGPKTMLNHHGHQRAAPKAVRNGECSSQLLPRRCATENGAAGCSQTCRPHRQHAASTKLNARPHAHAPRKRYTLPPAQTLHPEQRLGCRLAARMQKLPCRLRVSMIATARATAPAIVDGAPRTTGGCVKHLRGWRAPRRLVHRRPQARPARQRRQNLSSSAAPSNPRSPL